MSEPSAKLVFMPAAALRIEVIECLRDNYAFVAIDQKEHLAWLIDAPEAKPIIWHFEGRSLRLQGILATHHHPDHVGAIPELRAHFSATLEFVLAFEGERDRIGQATHYLSANTQDFSRSAYSLGDHALECLHVPGHTRGHVAFKLGDDVFTGDCLFAAGCGRLFEGSAAQMYHSLSRLTALPDHTRLWFGHEYTRANLDFAAVAEPDNLDIQARLEQLAPCTVPSTVGLEKRTNPFVRARDSRALSERREAKNNFRA